MKIEDQIEFKVNNSDSRITFQKTGGGAWKVWDRFISIDKENLYHIGNICGTCEFFFLKQEKSLEINFNKDILIASLNAGQIAFNEENVDKLSKIIPDGNYLVLKTKIKPKIVTNDSGNNYFWQEQRKAWDWGFDAESLKPNSNFNSYYRENLVDFGKMGFEYKSAFFNFFVPLYKVNQLNQSRVDFYKEQISNDQMPYAISIGVLDVKSSESYPFQDGEEIEPEFKTHWCLANYIIDGHHKLKAASDLNKELGLITFISRDESWTLINEMVSNIKEPK